MAAKNQIFVLRKKSRSNKIWKTKKEFWNKIWLKVEKHEYIYNFEIKFEKIILFKNGSQNKFCNIAQ